MNQNLLDLKKKKQNLSVLNLSWQKVSKKSNSNGTGYKSFVKIPKKYELVYLLDTFA